MSAGESVAKSAHNLNDKCAWHVKNTRLVTIHSINGIDSSTFCSQHTSNSGLRGAKTNITLNCRTILTFHRAAAAYPDTTASAVASSRSPPSWPTVPLAAAWDWQSCCPFLRCWNSCSNSCCCWVRHAAMAASQRRQRFRRCFEWWQQWWQQRDAADDTRDRDVSLLSVVLSSWWFRTLSAWWDATFKPRKPGTQSSVESHRGCVVEWTTGWQSVIRWLLWWFGWRRMFNYENGCVLVCMLCAGWCCVCALYVWLERALERIIDMRCKPEMTAMSNWKLVLGTNRHRNKRCIERLKQSIKRGTPNEITLHASINKIRFQRKFIIHFKVHD